MHHNNIGTLRYIAALMVLFGHGYNLCIGMHGWLDPISKRLALLFPFYMALPGLGVMLFFVISGYLITESFIKRRHLISYFVARVLRIYPALIMAVLFCVLIVGLLVTELPKMDYLFHKGTLRYLVYNAALIQIHFFLPGVFSSLPWKGGVNGSLWTLPIEVFMYAMVGVFGTIGIFRRIYIYNLFAFIVVLLAVLNHEKVFLIMDPQNTYLTLSFLFGSVLFVNKDKVPLNFYGVCLLGFASFLAWKTPGYSFISLSFFAYLVLWIGLHQSFKLPQLDKHGDFSYGLYLYAYPFQQLSIYYLGSNSPMLINTTAFMGAMVMAFLSWHLIEKRVLLYRETLSHLISGLIEETLNLKRYGFQTHRCNRKPY